VARGRNRSTNKAKFKFEIAQGNGQIPAQSYDLELTIQKWFSRQGKARIDTDESNGQNEEAYITWKEHNMAFSSAV
jgi:hypothetical protein